MSNDEISTRNSILEHHYICLQASFVLTYNRMKREAERWRGKNRKALNEQLIAFKASTRLSENHCDDAVVTECLLITIWGSFASTELNWIQLNRRVWQRELRLEWCEQNQMETSFSLKHTLIDDGREKIAGRHDVEKSHLLYTFSLLRRLVAQTWKMSPTYSCVLHIIEMTFHCFQRTNSPSYSATCTTFVRKWIKNLQLSCESLWPLQSHGKN